MVGDGRWRDAACFQTQPTQWFDHELMRSAAAPARGAVPAINFRTIRHRGSMPDKRAFVFRCGGGTRWEKAFVSQCVAEHRVEALSGKKLCNINERLNPF
jgi:hypothetical protein